MISPEYEVPDKTV